MDFKDYLKSKKIDPAQFENSEPEMYKKWINEYDQMHPKSFESRKLFQINAIRRKYKYHLADTGNKSGTSSVRPVIKPKIKR